MEAAGGAHESEGQRLWAALVESGLVGKKLACFEKTDAGDIAAQLCTAVGLVYQSRYGHLVSTWIAAAKSDEPLKKRLRGEHTMDALHLGEWELRNALDGKPASSGLRRLVEHEDWLPRPLRARSHGDQSKARQEAEDELREKWAVELVNEMKRVRAPALQELELCVDPSRLPAALAGKTRASTLRRYVKTWRDWLAWLDGTKGGLDHASPGAFCEYLFHRFDEPCGPTVPPFIVKAVAWFEKAAMLDSSERVADAQVVFNVRDHVVGMLSRNAPPVRRAPRYPAVLFEAFEDMVLNDRMCVGIRIVAWVKLLKLWGTLRYDDLQRIIPSELRYTWGRLATVLKVTKTSGPAKRVQEMPVVISDEAYVRSADWIKVGFDLLRRAAPFDRDYLLPKMTGDMNFFVQKMASYNDMCAYSATLRRLVRLPRSGDKLIPAELVGFWTEHSERATVPTGLAILGTRKEERDMLGRWRPEGSDAYIRSYGGIVRRLQKKFAKILRSEERSEELDERDIAESAMAWLQERSPQEAGGGDADPREDVMTRLGQAMMVGPQFEVPPEQGEELPGGDEDGETLEMEPADGVEHDQDPDMRRAAYMVVRVSGSCRRLHRAVGGCWMGRSKVFRSATEYDKKPEESEYTHVCRVCWPPRRGEERASESPDGSSSSSSSSSSDVETTEEQSARQG